MVQDLYASKKYRVLAAVLSLIVLFESMYCLLALLLLGGLKKRGHWYKWLKVGSFILILAMGIWMLLESRKNNQAVKKNTLYRGILNVIIHPQQIPFWLIIGVVINPLMKFGMDVFALAGLLFLMPLGRCWQWAFICFWVIRYCGISILIYLILIG